MGVCCVIATLHVFSEIQRVFRKEALEWHLHLVKILPKILMVQMGRAISNYVKWRLKPMRCVAVPKSPLQYFQYQGSATSVRRD